MTDWHFIDFSPVAQFVLDTEHRILRWNLPCEMLTGFKAADMVGTTGQWKPFHARPRPILADALLDQNVNLLKGYGAESVKMSGTVRGAWEFDVSTEMNGKMRHLHCIATPAVDAGGRTIGVVESIQDVTEQKLLEQELRQSNEDYRTLAENFPQCFLVTQDTKLVLVNKLYATMLGYPDPESIIGLNASELIAESHRSQFIKNIELVISGKSPLRKNQWPHLAKNGASIWLEGHPRRISWRGRPALLSTLVDITEIRLRQVSALAKSAQLIGADNIVDFSVQDRYRLGDLVGKSEAMREVYSLVVKAAASSENVIISGESGTGKEVVARTIHDLSTRSENRFIPINCGAVPAELMESEFFGFKRGAFTGAHADKPGYLAAADRGTLFLDEVGELPLNMQVKLLRVLENFTYTPLGSSEVRTADIRVIAATNRDLLKHVQEGRMREDFFYRLYVIPIHLPPLRERKEDIALLVEHFVTAQKSGRFSSFMPGYIMDALHSYDWPGNVRELYNTIQRFLTLGKLDMVQKQGQPPGAGLSLVAGDGPVGNLKKHIELCERELLQKALLQTAGNRSRAAELLGISRKGFYRKAEKWRLLDT